MRRFVVAAVVVCSLSASAQSVDITFGGLHAGVHVDGAELTDAPVPVVVQAPPVVVVQQPPVVVLQQPQEVAAGMPGPDFAALLAAVEEEGFSSDKLGVIHQAVDGGAWFTCAQVGQLVDLLAMGDDKVQVVSLTRARLVDPNNGFSLTKKFSFSSDKEKVRRLLGS